VLDFAELRDFADLKLKNYSSGMMVRLAFAIMVQADADIMLIDEVLAVGDAAFAQKCMDVFHQRRRAGRTVVLVTHDMGAVQTLCDRAMLLHDGERLFTGEPEDAAMRYLRQNFPKPGGGAGVGTGHADFNVAIADARLSVPPESDAPIELDVRLDALRDFDRGEFEFQLRREDGVLVGTFTRRLDAPVAAGQVVRLAGELENRLGTGRYHLDCWIRRHHAGDLAVQAVRLVVFEVRTPAEGLITLRADVDAAVEDGA
jgi:hypothetical protein